MDNPLKFSYTRFPILDYDGKEVDEVFRPLIPVTFVDGPKEITTFAIIDTGADECCFPGQLATYLGHNLTKGHARPFVGVGGTVDWDGPGICLLGQNSFLTRFNVTFNRKDKEFEVLFRG